MKIVVNVIYFKFNCRCNCYEPAAGDFFKNFRLNKVHFQIFFQKVGKVGEKSKSRRKVGEMAKK